jgi:hypothetical protein
VRIPSELTLYNMDCVKGSRIHLEPESIYQGIYDPAFGFRESRFGSMCNRYDSYVLDAYGEFPSDPMKYYKGQSYG